MKNISYKGIQLKVSINRVFCKQTKYFVQLESNGNTLASFEMKPEMNSWKIVQPAPEWIDGLKNEIAAAIVNEEILQSAAIKTKKIFVL